MLTLQELKWIVKVPETKGKVPTARYLLEHGETVVRMENGRDIQLLVFRDGYALYRVGKYMTVFNIHNCGGYSYENNEKESCVDGAFFEQQEWYIRLLLEGEDRLIKNRETRQREKTVSYHAVSEEWMFLSDPVLSPLERLVEKEQILELIGLLTERQKTVVILYFYHGKTEREIAGELGVAQSTVSQVMMAALRRMRNGEKYVSKKGAMRRGGVSYAW